MLYLTSASEKSVFVELWEYFRDKYFSNDLPYLDNFTVRGNQVLFYKLIIIGMCLGLIVAAFCNIYNKRYVGNFVRKVIKEGCLGPDSAKTLSEIGHTKMIGIYGLIRSGGSLSRWIRCAEEDEFVSEVERKRKEFEENNIGKKKKFIEPKFKRDVKTMHFYLPEERRIAAELRFDTKGANMRGAILVTLLSITMCLVLCYMLSDTIKLFDNFISMMNGNS